MKEENIEFQLKRVPQTCFPIVLRARNVVEDLLIDLKNSAYGNGRGYGFLTK
jgi:hypothetical protein